MEFKWLFIMMAIVFGTAFCTMSFNDYQESQLAMKAMERGYIQCQELSITSSDYKELVWKKECK